MGNRVSAGSITIGLRSLRFAVLVGAQLSKMDRNQASAYHEAGHAVFAWRYGYMLRGSGLSIDHDRMGTPPIRSEIYLGVGKRLAPYSFARLNLDKRSRVEAEIALAGPLAECRARRLQGQKIGTLEINRTAFSSVLRSEPLEDLGEAARVLAEFLDDEEIAEGLRQTRDSVIRLLRQAETWKAVEVLAGTLLTENHLSAERAEALIFAISPPRALWPHYGKRTSRGVVVHRGRTPSRRLIEI